MSTLRSLLHSELSIRSYHHKVTLLLLVKKLSCLTGFGKNVKQAKYCHIVDNGALQESYRGGAEQQRYEKNYDFFLLL